SFQPPQSFQTAYLNYYIIAADFNGDGIPDVACSSYDDGGAISVLLGNGDGTLGPVQNYSVSSQANELAVSDLNADGHADIVVAIEFPGPVVLLNRGDGTFLPGVQYETGSLVFNLSIGDLNADGKADLAVTDLSDNTFSVLFGNGDGTFAPEQEYPAGD